MSDPKSPVSRHGLGGGLAARQVEAPIDLESVRRKRAEDKALLARVEALRLDEPGWEERADLEPCTQAAMRWWWDRGEVRSELLDAAYTEHCYLETPATARRWLREVAAYLRGAR